MKRLKEGQNGLAIAERVYAKAGHNGHNGHGKNGHVKRELNVDRQLPLNPAGKKGEEITLETIDLHPLVANFPPAAPEQIHQLAADMKLAGKTSPFVLCVDWSAKHTKGGIWFLLDDRNRFLACEIAGIAPQFHQRESIDKTEACELAVRLNLPNNHLTTSQKAAIAVPVVERLAAAGSKRSLDNLYARQRQTPSEIATKTAIPANPLDGPKLAPRGNGAVEQYLARNPEARINPGERAAERAAHLFGVSASNIKLATQIRRDDPELFEHVRLNKGPAGWPADKEFNLSAARIQLHKRKSLKLATALPSNEKVNRRKSSDELILNGDCLKLMPDLPGGKFTVIFADPPYNNGFKYDADPTHDDRSPRDYIIWCKNWMAECSRLLKPNGSLFIMIDDNYSDNFGMALREMKDPPLYRRNTILWWERFAQHSKTNFTNTVRFIHYFTRSPKDFIWNADQILVPSDRETIYKDARRGLDGKVPDNVWEFPRLVANDPRRVPYPICPPQVHPDLLQRIIKVASNEGDTVFDPFAGNGGTLREALALGRNAFGIERSPLYAKQAREWIAAGEGK